MSETTRNDGVESIASGEKDWRAALGDLPRFAPDFELEPGRTALLLVDMQSGYIREGAGLVRYLRAELPEAHAYYLDRVNRLVIPNQQRLLALFRELDWPVVFITFAAHLPSAADWLPLRRQREAEIEAEAGSKTAILVKGHPDAAVIEELAPRQDELVVNKVSRGAFNSTGIDALLRNMGITGLVVAGVITNVCVETTARDAADRGFKVVLVNDACATYTQAAHNASMKIFASIFGDVMDTEELLEALNEKGGSNAN